MTPMLEMETTPSETSSAEKLLEYVVHIHIHSSSSASSSLFLLPDSFLTKLIIGTSFIWVTQGLVRICNFLELCLGSLWVILILVWMILNS